MKVWIDILTPKQANFSAELQRRLNGRAFKTLLTTREYREVNELLQLRGVKALAVGRHGGGQLKDKLEQSAERIIGLTKIVDDAKPDLAISFSSPEAARVAFGLGIPHYTVCDSPHAEAVCRLTIPLSQKLFTPWVIPMYAWKRYGIQARDVVRYRALDPYVWLNGYRNDPKAVKDLGIDTIRPVVVVRPPEELASYLSDRAASVSGTTTAIIEKVLELDKSNELQVVVLPRYDSRAEKFRKRFGNRVIVPEHVIDSISLMQVSAVFLGGGGTMTAESALLGLPVISYFPGEQTFVERFLIKCGLVERLLDPGRIAQRAVSITASQDLREFYRRRSARLLRGMVDPLRVIIQRIFKS